MTAMMTLDEMSWQVVVVSGGTLVEVTPPP